MMVWMFVVRKESGPRWDETRDTQREVYTKQRMTLVDVRKSRTNVV
jgi:hypothetical protein